MPPPDAVIQSGLSKEQIGKCAQKAYSTFLTDMRDIAPALCAVQPEWARMPETMKQVWRHLTEASLREADSLRQAG